MARTSEALRFLAGTFLAGYGGLVVLRFLAHESWWVGSLLLIAGVALLLTLPRRAPREKFPEEVTISAFRRGAVAAVGLVAAGGTVGYNLLARSSISLPEGAIIAYGAALLAAAPYLGRRIGRTDVGTLVAWSLPVLAAPLGMYAMDAYFDARLGVGGSPLDAFIVHWLVAPMAVALNAMGFDASASNQVVRLTTPRGNLFLSVGVVCAGLEPGVLFLGVFGLYAWKEQTPPKRLAALLALGLVGVYVANLIRLIALAFVGYQWGGAALQTAHQHFGWMLFVGWMLIYWWLVMRRWQGAAPAKSPSGGA